MDVVWANVAPGADAIVPLECGDIYHQGIPGSQLHVIDACGEG